MFLAEKHTDVAPLFDPQVVVGVNEYARSVYNVGVKRQLPDNPV